MKSLGLGCVLWFLMGTFAFGSVPARLEYQGYLTDAVGTAIDCQGCTTPYTFKFSIFDEQADGTLLWSEVHELTHLVQGVFHVELGLQEVLDAELLDGSRWLEIQINDHMPLAPRQPIISVPYALRANVAEHAVESENAVSLGGQPVESFVQVADTDVFVTESELGDQLTNLGYIPGDNDSLSDLNACAVNEILKWDGGVWTCSIDLNSDPLSTLLCAGGEIGQWDGSTWVCSSALDVLVADTAQVQANVDQVQINMDTLDASLDPIAKTGLPADLDDGDDNSQLSEAEVLAMVTGAGYITGDHFSGAWGDLSGVPADINDGDADTQLSEAQVDAFADNNGYALDADLVALAKSGAWADISGIPADIADGDADTDTVGALDCSDGQVPEWDGSSWTCGAGSLWTDGGTYLAASNAPQVVVANNGRVGIGTSVPEADLHIESAADPYIKLKRTDTPTNWNIIAHSTPSYLAFNEDSAGSHLVVSSGGNVGIGTTSPQASLELETGNIRFRGGDQKIEWGTSYWIQRVGSSYIEIGTENGTRVVIDSNGRVGIGTIEPSETLTVGGVIETTTGGVRFPDGTLQTSAAGGGAPVGSVVAWMTSTIPSGYIECDGRTLSRTAYADLFDIIGIRYGTTDGSNFKIPDFRGQFLRGWSNGSGQDPDASSRTSRGDGVGGDNVGTRQTQQVQSHRHNITARDIVGSYGGDQNFWEIGGGGKRTEYTGGNETRPRNVYVVWIIKY